MYENRCHPPQTLRFDLFSSAVTLKIRVRSPKSIQVLAMPKFYSHTNLAPIPRLADGIHVQSGTK